MGHTDVQGSHRQSQDPRNGGRQTPIGRDLPLALAPNSNACDQRRARRQDLRSRMNANRHPGGREGDTSFVSEGREAHRPVSKSNEDKPLVPDDERQPRRARHAYENFPARRGEREEEGKWKIPGNGRRQEIAS